MEYRCYTCGSDDVLVNVKRGVVVCQACEVSGPLRAQATGLRLFLSYGHDGNEPIVLRLRRDLELRGHTVWIDSTGIRAGDDWRASITRGLLSSDSVLSFLSCHSVRKPGVCLDELRIALCEPSTVIRTVLLESESEVAVPTTLASVQWLDMSSWKVLQESSPAEFADWYDAKFAELCQVLEGDQSRTLAGEITRLQSLLRPSMSDARERQLLASDFVGREWLEAELEQWRLTQPDLPAFVLLGGPGLGKSRFAVQQLHYNPNVLCAVFCNWGADAMGDVKGVVNTMAFRLACRLPDYRHLLLRSIEGSDLQDMRRLSDLEYFDAIVSGPLNQLIDGSRPRSLVIIDGLDELESGGRNDLALMLSDGLRRLPAWLGVVVTSRPEAGVLQALGDWPGHHLDASDARQQLDIRRYLAVHLRDQLRDGQVAPLIDQIVRNAEGSFLYATLLVENSRRAGFRLDDPANYPVGLSSIYAATMVRRFPRPADFVAVRGLLEVLVAAHPCPRSLLLEAASADPYALNDLLLTFGSLLDVSERDLAHLCGSLTCVSFCHKSIADWLTDSQRSSQFFVDAGKGRRQVANALLRWVQADCRASSVTSGPVPHGQENDHAEAKYRRTAVTGALAAAEMWVELEQFLADPATPLWPYWRALSLFPQDWDSSELLMLLWQAPGRGEFLREALRVGDGRLALDVLSYFGMRFGAENMDVDLINLEVDAKHLSGRYTEAVALCDTQLAGRPVGEVTAQEGLLRLAVRRLHHSMFFLPVDPLINDARELVAQVDRGQYPQVFNELLFLLGGNLGVLSGDFVSARVWLDECVAFAQSRSARDFELRSLRKHAELLALSGQLESAYDIVSPLVSPDGRAESRYEVYLLGVRGEIARMLGRRAEAVRCHTELSRQATLRAIPGWRAHASLGLAAVSIDLNDADQAQAHLGHAVTQYEDIGMAWGRVAAELLSLRLAALVDGGLSEQVRATAASTARLAASLNYRYEAGLLNTWATLGECAEQHHLNFL